MNRIIIIGNGFDLAQGLKTSYEDFLLDYLKSHIRKLENENLNFTEDQIIKIKINDRSEISFSDLLNTSSLNSFLNNEIFEQKTKIIDDVNNRFDPFATRKLNYYIAKLDIKSDFFRKILSSQNWTDLEHSYYEYLIYLFQSKQSSLKLQQNKQIIEFLNSDFSFIKQRIIFTIVR